nr:TMV resistance protein N-like isoform X1 [Ipomoea batatas]
MIQELPLNLGSIFLGSCKSLKMLPILPPDLENIFLDGCESLEMLPELPLNLERIRLTSCKNLKMLSGFPSNLSHIFLDLISCKKLKEFKGWENLHSIRTIEFRGVPHTDFSESIKEVLIRSMNFNDSFDCSLTYNEIPDWIRSNDLYDYYGCGDIKAGEVIKATPIIEIYEGLYRDGNRSSFGEANLVKKIGVKASVVKKIGIEALYIDKDGSLQLLPLTKVG